MSLVSYPLSQAPVLPLVALFAPAVGALVLAAVWPLRKRGMPAAVVCIAASVASLVAAALLFADQMNGGQPAEWVASWLSVNGHGVGRIGVHIDGISASMLVVVTTVALCVQVFSIGYMHDETPGSFGRYFAYHALFLFSMNLLVVAPDLLELFAGWELVGTTSYLLIGFYYKKPSAARAAVKAFWVTKFADMGFVMALLVLYAHTGAFEWTATITPAVATAVSAFLFLGVVGKSAQFPLHVWLPDAMEGPTPVSALLHAATMVAAGVYLIVRATPIFAAAPDTRAVMMIVGAATALFAAGLATVQTDIKKVLAYSTCSQLGYMVTALGAGSMFGGFFHLTTHAFFKALLFLAAGSVIHAVHSNEIPDMGGLRKKMPVTATVFIVGALALAGVPMLSGFFSKDLVLASVEGKLGWVPYATLMATAFMTAFYMGKVILATFFGAPSEKAHHAHEPGLSMIGPLVLLAILSIGAGYAASPLAHLAGGEYEMHLGTTPFLATGLGLTGFALAWVYQRRAAGAGLGVLAPLDRVARTGAVNRLYLFIFQKIMVAGADVLGWIDRYVVDGLMNFLGWSTIMSGRALRRLQTGLVKDYVYAVVAGTVALAAWGLWP